MKIIQVSTFFHPSVGGVERQVEEIAFHLIEKGHHVEVFTTDATHGKEKRMQRLIDNYRGIPIRRYRYQLRLGYFFRFSIGLTWKLLRADYDVIHVHNIHDGHLLPAIVIKTLRRKKLVVTGHNPHVVSVEKRGETLHWWVGFYEFVFRIMVKGVDRYIALLESEKQTMIQKFRMREDRIVVIPNGIQELYYFPEGAAENFVSEWDIDLSKWKLIVGAACRLNYVKGLQNLEQAAKGLPEVLFIFAGGDDGYAHTLKRIFSDLPNVLFTDQYLPSVELKDFYAAIDLFLLPSIYEPFGMTLVEAMAQKKPVLSTNQGGPVEIITSGIGELIDPTDQAAWLERIKYYAWHKEELPKMGDKAAKLAQKYKWDNVIAEIIDTYKSLLPNTL